jgi:1,4-dihydroxy-2-naphthoyl-CoA synthase
MTGDVVKAMRHCPQPVIAAVEGVCAGAGAILAMASDLQAQAELMLTKDFHRAYEAFAARRKPLFEGD